METEEKIGNKTSKTQKQRERERPREKEIAARGRRRGGLRRRLAGASFSADLFLVFTLIQTLFILVLPSASLFYFFELFVIL
jgi:hypothetical protein